MKKPLRYPFTRKVALIGDVHANLPALEAVLAHAHQLGVETIWNVGDFVGYGAFPDQVVKRLRKENALSIVGNYDRKVLRFKKKRKKWRKSKHPDKFLAFQWAYKNLSKKSRKYLRSLPQEIRLQAEGWRILLTHGSPASDAEHLTPDTPEKRLHELAQMADADAIICGHSHHPFVRQVNGVRFVNTGSVGRPDDGDPRACYAILYLGPKRFQVYHYRVEYDVEKAVAAIRRHKLPEAFAQMILQGRALDVVLETAEA
jgi:putative phosphoesterase